MASNNSDMDIGEARLYRLLEDIGVTLKGNYLFEVALTHCSVSQTVSNNERLEFLGDSVLSLTISEELYQRLPYASEGVLTKARAAIIQEATLANAARRLDFGRLIRLDRSQETTGGRDRDSILADCFEAVLASIYLTHGWQCSVRFVHAALEFAMDAVIRGELPVDSKSRLQELLQTVGKSTPTYRIVSDDGPDHAKTFVAEVEHDGAVLGSGCGPSKKRAEQMAAEAALRMLRADA